MMDNDRIAQVAAEIRNLNPDYEGFEEEVVRLIRAGVPEVCVCAAVLTEEGLDLVLYQGGRGGRHIVMENNWGCDRYVLESSARDWRVVDFGDTCETVGGVVVSTSPLVVQVGGLTAKIVRKAS